jgi:hypothetical protein
MNYKRPASASVQHCKPSFGEFYRTTTLDQGPKVTRYQIDGSGRDSYINFNNGGNNKPSVELGFFKYSQKKGKNLFNSGKSYNVIPKLSIYKSDGMGRDSYIVKDCGGHCNDGSKTNHGGFRTNLRSYEVKPTKVLFNDYSLLCKNHLLKPVEQKIKQVATKQRVLSARLSVPKRVTTKYNNHVPGIY